MLRGVIAAILFVLPMIHAEDSIGIGVLFDSFKVVFKMKLCVQLLWDKYP